MGLRLQLTLARLQAEAKTFAEGLSDSILPLLYGVTDGKAVGTYVEHAFREYLLERTTFSAGNSASGIDFPELGVDLKVTSIRQPQSSCPFRSARQKVYGLGYHLLIFVYEKQDDATSAAARLLIQHVIFIDQERTADYQLTSQLRSILENAGNSDDVMACLMDRNLPLDEIAARNLAEEIVRRPPEQGYLTISNALQWRLQYGRVIERAGQTSGVLRLK